MMKSKTEETSINKINAKTGTFILANIFNF